MAFEEEDQPVEKKRRKRWTREQKRRIVAESAEEGVNVASVARKYGIASNQLYRWRSTIGLGAPASGEADEVRRLHDRVETLEERLDSQSRQLQTLLSTIITAQIGC